MNHLLLNFCTSFKDIAIKRTSTLLLLTLCFTGFLNAQNPGSDAVLGTAEDFSEIIGYHVSSANSTAKSNSKYSSTLSGNSNKIILKTPSGEFTGTINLARAIGTSNQIVGNGEKAGTQFELKSEADGTISGLYTSTSDNIAYKYYTNSEDGTVHVKEIDINSVMCVNYNKTSKQLEHEVSEARSESTVAATPRPSGVQPKQESLPGSQFVIYLDFDGEVYQGQWFGGGVTNAAPIGFTTGEMDTVWTDVSEDFAPFNVNVTTSRAVYDATSITNKLMVIVTSSILYPGAGGVAHMNSFGAGDVCWSFVSHVPSCGLVISHEIGHAMGLHHDGINNHTYYSGHNNWGPIMGTPYHKTLSHWSRGEYNGATQTQDDLHILATNYGFGYNPDLAGDNFLSAASLTVQNDGTVQMSDNKGLIEKSSDKDVYSFTTSVAGSVNLHFNPNKSFPNLNIQARLLDSNGSEITISNPTNSLGANLIASVGKGTFYVEIDGVGDGASPSVGYSDYGSIGPYTITGIIPPPNNTLTTDCNNELGGTAFMDNCGVCAEGNTGIIANSSCGTYCYATGDIGTGSDYINSVTYGSVSNNSALEYYADLTHLKASFSPCQKVGVTVKLDWAFPANFCYAWVDWNRNGAFDTNERTDFPVFSNNSTYTEIAVPAYAVGDFTMRIRNTYHHSLPGVPTPCGTNAGEVEDYTINISKTCIKDCNGDIYGAASVDNCNVCSGGNTGIVPNSTCLTYCTSAGDSTTGSDFIRLVEYGSVYNNSSREYYEDFTKLSANFPACQKVDVAVTLGHAFVDDYCFAWVDWNKNGVFDVNERTDFPVYSNDRTFVEIPVPANAVGTYTMRLRNIYATTLPVFADPCGVSGISGEVEDYTINISNTCNKDCNGDINGAASVDNCHVCSGGNTGIIANSSCAPNCTTTIQAEDVIVGGGATVNTSNAGNNGTGYVNFPATGGFTEFTVQGCTAGWYTLEYRHALANGTRSADLFVNGTKQQITVTSSGSWSTYKTETVIVNIKQGANTIRIQSNGADFGNLDQIELAQLTVSTQNIEASDYLLIYPNPVHDQVNIGGEFSNWTLTDALGAFIKEGTNKVVNVGGLNSGLYYLRVNGKVMKFIKN
jgi:hypothetical protein